MSMQNGNGAGEADLRELIDRVDRGPRRIRRRRVRGTGPSLWRGSTG
jgi:hypothetical protein